MKNLFVLFASLLLLVLTTQCTQSAPDENAEAAAQPAVDTVKRGEYLVEIMGCHDCHSPKIMTAQGPALDPKLLLSGHPANAPLPAITDPNMVKPGQWVLFHPMNTAAVGPWGTSYSANLTPDVTGIGEWSFEQFKKALTEGKYKGMDNNRMLLPPMPWTNYRKIADEDIRAIFAYLKSLPAVSNQVPAPVPPASM